MLNSSTQLPSLLQLGICSFRDLLYVTRDAAPMSQATLDVGGQDSLIVNESSQEGEYDELRTD